MADGFGVAFGQDADGGQAVLLKLAKSFSRNLLSVEHHHVTMEEDHNTR